MLRTLQQIVIIFLLILSLAAIPMIVEVNQHENRLKWHFEKLPGIYGDFISEISNGSLGTYQLGSQHREIAGDIGNNFFTSLKIMLIGVNVSIIISLIFGIFISRFRLTKLLNFILNVLSAIPDFIIIILSLILAVKFYKVTGVRIISLRADAGALNLWFPTLLVSIAPTIYMFKLVSVRYLQTSSEDYIKTAVAKGMRLNYINFQHVYKNVEPFIKAELIKVISLSIGNLFIVEYIMNVSGITKFIFQSNEIQPIAIGLFSMLLISGVVFLSIRLVLYLFKRGFIYE
ncbi:ABC transporter permease subunit [Bacillus sp. DTU_2020_1000418_1_SI_GHA_SEK_038]|uniref:ABC transporter permease subunit n=1 Tax=Bacillus sp. DTU_2020_1000418_1_SI_GHA_SEK_038 TaxID=3077585 RepID=UPI0028E948F5|nr:ABC transporter permease subunit [Bacillus sp. DTU_2020_1000418_1_SI_GHA_SEK_038]WNS73990.1 ABC transporter permease subunit [Bacillus sp. DTU_2020_1000418_1_SI_GHA_SEK_038]